MRHLKSALVFLAANGIGLLVAILLLEGFTATVPGFIVAVLIFSLVQAVARPLIERLSRDRLPQIMGGIALVTIFVGLWITQLFVGGLVIGGVSNWLAATLLVWLGSLVASIVLPMIMGRKAQPQAR
jgi:uncharacterized membrane protein YvlD (DUF360 family)